ncbi:MAG TPA: low temperature requirement protein A [Galbitalea sp.]|jgi:low temperature requirement protein LtrA|nr:low temperature requirement protein A [Galbitalea sp.]
MTPWFRATSRSDADGGRVSTFELFFDLVFVFAFTQVTHFMVVAHSDIGVLQAIVMLGFLWWSWSSYGWLANQSRVDLGILRAGLVVAMCAVFVLALAIPTAFVRIPGALNAALVVAIAYFLVRIVHMALYLVASGDDRALRRQVLRTSVSMWVSVGLIVVGAIIGGPAQTGIWLGAFIADMLITYLTSHEGDWHVRSAQHWSERHGLVVLLALGESIVAIGEGAAHSSLTLVVLGGAVLALLLATLLWWLYFDAISIAAERILAKKPDRERAALATDGYTYVHLLLIAGIVISALGVEEAMGIANSGEQFGLFGACALFGGTSLYLFAHALFWKRVGGAWKVWRLAGATLLLALIPIGTFVPSIAALGMTVGAVAIVVTIESVLFSAARREIRESAKD